MRYRVDYPLPFDRRRRVDIAFTRVKVSVFIDGCFFHGCSEHGSAPRTNSAFRSKQIARNRARDVDTSQRLAAAGWTVLQFWEHNDVGKCAESVVREVIRSAVHRSAVHLSGS
jgi:DNA mismatch endonuclease (patch repair protein)